MRLNRTQSASGRIREQRLFDDYISRERHSDAGLFLKFLVLWKFQASLRLGLPEVAKVISGLQDYARQLEGQKKLECFYHIIGGHGGAWIFDVESNEELEVLLAKMPVYNFAEYVVYPLSEMKPT